MVRLWVNVRSVPTVMVVAALVVLVGLCPRAHAGGATRDLSVEFRQLESDPSEQGHYSAGSDASANQWEPQMLQVRNGEKAALRLNDAVPMQWLQSAKSQSSSLSAGAASASASASIRSSGGSATNALAWFDAGQSLSVEVNWNPAKPYAVLTIEVQHASFDQRVGGDLPRQSRATVSTTVTTPLAEWVTIAASGTDGDVAASTGSYRSDRGHHKRRLLQVRVMAL